MHLSALERFPHFLVALRRPDARIAILRGFIEGARDIERHAVVEDHPVAEFRLERGVGQLVDLVQVLARGRASFTWLYSSLTKPAFPRSLGHLLRRLERGAAARHQLLRVEARRARRAWPASP